MADNISIALVWYTFSGNHPPPNKKAGTANRFRLLLNTLDYGTPTAYHKIQLSYLSVNRCQTGKFTQHLTARPLWLPGVNFIFFIASIVRFVRQIWTYSTRWRVYIGLFPTWFMGRPAGQLYAGYPAFRGWWDQLGYRSRFAKYKRTGIADMDDP